MPNLIVELADFLAKLDCKAAAIDHEQFIFLISRLEGATRNLGAQRVADLLTQKFESAQDSGSESRAGFCSALRRETAMLSRAIAILKSEQSQPAAGRGSNQSSMRHGAIKSRWRFALVTKDAGQPKDPSPQSESVPAATSETATDAPPSPTSEAAAQAAEQTQSEAARS